MRNMLHQCLFKRCFMILEIQRKYLVTGDKFFIANVCKVSNSFQRE